MSLWEENVRKVVPYTPGEQPNQPDMVKLNTNENPYPPSPAVGEAMKKLDLDSMRLYPDPTASELVQILAERYQVEPDQVFVGIGSDDVLAMSFLTFFNSGSPILFPDITYSFYDVWADCFRIPYVKVPLDQDFRIRPEDYCPKGETGEYSIPTDAAGSDYQTLFGRKPIGGIVFPNPNAPTGELLGLDAIEQILKANPGVVVIIDEAYIDFGGQSALPLLDRYENLLITQTFSKSRSLAGMRVGFALGSSKMIKYLNDVKYSFNSYTLSRAAISMAAASVRDEDYFRETIGKIVDTREWAKGQLKELGFTFPDSASNFIFAKHKSVQAKELFRALREAHIYVRYFDKPRIDDYLRITIGTREQMEKLFDFLRDYLAK